MKDPGTLNPAGPPRPRDGAAPPLRYDGLRQSGGRTLIWNVVSGLCFQADEARNMQTEEDASRTALDPAPVTVSLSVHQ